MRHRGSEASLFYMAAVVKQNTAGRCVIKLNISIRWSQCQMSKAKRSSFFLGFQVPAKTEECSTRSCLKWGADSTASFHRFFYLSVKQSASSSSSLLDNHTLPGHHQNKSNQKMIDMARTPIRVMIYWKWLCCCHLEESWRLWAGVCVHTPRMTFFSFNHCLNHVLADRGTRTAWFLMHLHGFNVPAVSIEETPHQQTCGSSLHLQSIIMS